jgi:hypothetical protein
MTIDRLGEKIQYGRLLFDSFDLCIAAAGLNDSVKTKWDYLKSTMEDKQQWNELVLEWLALTLHGRHPYHIESAEGLLLPLNSEQINRILVPFQTVHERKVTMHNLSHVWLRIWYTAELAESYIVPNELDNIVKSDNFLDN